MKIAAVCITYDRPRQLEQMIRMFELQTWPDRELVIVDDAGQYCGQCGDGWRLVSLKRRFASLGQKRNYAISLVSPDVDAIAVMDDDDTYLPWWLEACEHALRKHHWARPSIVWDEWDEGRIETIETFNRSNPNDKCYHGAWAYRVDAFHRAGRYPETEPGDQDTALAWNMVKLFGPSVDPICERFPLPYYFYHRTGDDASRKLPQDDAKRFEHVAESVTYTLTPRWPEGYAKLLGAACGEPRVRPW